MTADLKPQLLRTSRGAIVFDPALVSQPQPELFDAAWLQGHATVQPVSGGRGEAWLVDYAQQHWVLRRYLRGGLVARFNRQLYLGWCLAATRAWKEWQLLHSLVEKGLPVPRPVAARVHWPRGRASGLYEGSILVERIDGARTLAQRIQQQPLSEALWQSVGRCIADFHRHNVYHADLNANNILFSGDDAVFLIDFDRGRIKSPGSWKQANLQRLKRSLLKLQGLHAEFHFNEQDWQLLIAAYDASSSA